MIDNEIKQDHLSILWAKLIKPLSNFDVISMVAIMWRKYFPVFINLITSKHPIIYILHGPIEKKMKLISNAIRLKTVCHLTGYFL